MSSSANLTETDLYANIKNMFKSSLIPFIITVLIYIAFLFKFPLNASENNISGEIIKSFNIGIITLIPAIIVLIFCLFKINVKISIGVSIIPASIFYAYYLYLIPLINMLNFKLIEARKISIQS